METFPSSKIDVARKTSSGDGLFKRYWLFFGLAGVLILTVLIRSYYSIPQYSATKITDKAFVSDANAVCKKYLPALISNQPQRNETLTNAQTSERVRTSADSMKTMRADLGVIPVASVDAAATNEWLARWDSYIALGYRYADAVAINNKSVFGEISSASEADSKKITAFALVNKIKECALRTVAPTSS